MVELTWAKSIHSPSRQYRSQVRRRGSAASVRLILTSAKPIVGQPLRHQVGVQVSLQAGVQTLRQQMDNTPLRFVLVSSATWLPRRMTHQAMAGAHKSSHAHMNTSQNAECCIGRVSKRTGVRRAITEPHRCAGWRGCEGGLSSPAGT